MLNRVALIGNLGADPESRNMPNGGQVVNFSIATTRRWKDKQSGERKEQTEWHRVVIFEKLAEICAQYLHKGSQVYIEGRIQARKWEKDGVDHYSTEIIADTMNMLGGRGNDAPAAAVDRRQERSVPGKAVEQFDDDIPY